MTSKHIRLRSLSFTGPDVEPAILPFHDGVNIIYGASNTGKSFVAKAVNFLLGGGDDLPDIDQRRPYDAALLSMVLPDGAEVTLYRSTKGGNLEWFEGLWSHRPKGKQGVALHSDHNAKSQNNVSQFLLSAIGLTGKEIVKNADGEKESVSFRKLAPYAIVGEGPIMDEGSPILSPIKTKNTAEKNFFRLLLTGMDDSAVVPQVKHDIRQAKIAGQIELVDELIVRIHAEIGDDAPTGDALNRQSDALAEKLNAHHVILQEKQATIDLMVRRRRTLSDDIDASSAKLAELEIMLDRFNELDRVFLSDIGRLHALEEGGFFLKTAAGRACALCGADPEHQTHTHAANEISQTQAAAASEIRKIERERRDLAQTVVSVRADTSGLSRRMQTMREELDRIELSLDLLRPEEARLRLDYDEVIKERDSINRLVGLYDELGRMTVRRSQLSSRDVARDNSQPKIQTGISSTVGHEFAQVVQELLRDWGYPGNPVVVFDPVKQDIQVNGKGRSRPRGQSLT